MMFRRVFFLTFLALGLEVGMVDAQTPPCQEQYSLGGKNWSQAAQIDLVVTPLAPGLPHGSYRYRFNELGDIWITAQGADNKRADFLMIGQRIVLTRGFTPGSMDFGYLLSAPRLVGQALLQVAPTGPGDVSKPTPFDQTMDVGQATRRMHGSVQPMNRCSIGFEVTYEVAAAQQRPAPMQRFSGAWYGSNRRDQISDALEAEGMVMEQLQPYEASTLINHPRELPKDMPKLPRYTTMDEVRAHAYLINTQGKDALIDRIPVQSLSLEHLRRLMKGLPKDQRAESKTPLDYTPVNP